MRYGLIILIIVVACGKEENIEYKIVQGANCYDKIGDINNDGIIDSNDCLGQKGETGEKGDKGAIGEKGEAGAIGVDSIKDIVTGLQKYKPSILDIKCNDGDSAWRGTGTKVENGQILTAHHVLENAIECDYYSNNVRIGGGGSFNQSNARDLIFIYDINWTEEGEKLNEVPINYSYFPIVGDLLIGMTHPGFYEDTIQTTISFVAAESMSEYERDTYADYWYNAFTTTDAATAGGSSGGPIFDSNGDIVAILVGGSVDKSLELAIVLPVNED
jgi:hypothetical protein